jgi:hypothetical protein
VRWPDISLSGFKIEDERPGMAPLSPDLPRRQILSAARMQPMYILFHA